MSKLFAYTGCRTTRERNARGKGIGIYQVDAGQWSLVDIQLTLDNPSFLALHRNQSVLYAVHGDGCEVSSFRIDARDGRLSHLNSQSCLGKNPVHLALSADGRQLLIANYASGNLSRLPILENGALGSAISSDVLPGNPGPRSEEQGSSHPHQIARYVTGQMDSDWHIVPDKGLDTVFAVKWPEHDTPTVLPHQWLAGSGPRHCAFHPALPLVYVANELDCTMTVWHFNPGNGALSPLESISTVPGDARNESSAAGIVIHPEAKMLYVSNRGHNAICTIPLDQKTGMPGSTEWTRTQGDFPRFISLDPQGEHLYAANERSDSIVQFAIDRQTGKLLPTGQIIETGSPVCIIFKTR